MQKVASIIALLLVCGFTRAQGGQSWWLHHASEKLVATTQPLTSPLQIHAGRLEYAPFQIAIAPSDAPRQFTAPQITYDTQWFTLSLYEQVYFPILKLPGVGEIFTLARDTQSTAIPDALLPLGTTLDVPSGLPGAVWVDVYIQPQTPAGDYPLEVSFAGEVQTAVITVYPVDIPPTKGVSIVIPTNKLENVTVYSNGDDAAFLTALNQLLRDHTLVPGTFVGVPRWTDSGWDFSALDAELDALPEGATFYAPTPFDEGTDAYVFADQSGEPYTVTDFTDAYFMQQLDIYFAALAEYLQQKGRLQDALAYPIDETVWVADEPDHNGPEGYLHLAEWKTIINRYGLRVSASRVSPVLYGEGWPPSDLVTDDTHVHLDLLDAGMEPYEAWMSNPGKTSSVYLNQYGDLIDLPASVHRAIAWHIYGRGITAAIGYEAMDWFTERWDLINPLEQPELIDPKFGGYGVGAIIYPGPLASIRLKTLRESVEDARLLDLYGFSAGPQAARDFAFCLTPSAMADSNPPATLWDEAHAALLQAVATGTSVSTDLCQPAPTYSDIMVVDAMEDDIFSGGEWSMSMSNVNFEAVTSPFDGSQAYQITYKDRSSGVSVWLGGRNWSQHNVLLIDVQNPTEYYVEFDIAIGDSSGNYLMLRPGSTNIAPNSTRTLAFPLVVAFPLQMNFNFGSVDYFELSAGTMIDRTTGAGEDVTYFLGYRTLIFDNVRLAKQS
jgi:hypothetical protein